MNKKAVRIILILVLVVATGAAAFYFMYLSKSTAHLALIPKEATFVMKFDNKQLYHKAGMSRDKMKDYLQDIREKAGETPEDIDQAVKKIAENPFSLGVDIVSDIYFFYAGNKGSGYMGVTFAVNDGKDLQTTITDLLKASKVEYVEDKTDHFNSVMMANDKSTIIAWDNKKGIVLTSYGGTPFDEYGADYGDDSDNEEEENEENKDIKKKAEELFTLKKESSLTSLPDFKNFIANSKDISIWGSANILQQYGLNEELGKQLGYSLEGASFNAFMEFEQQQITVTGGMNLNEAMKEKQARQNILGKGIPPVMLANLPKRTYATFSMSLNPDACYNMMQEEKNTFGEVADEFENKAGLSIKKFFDGLGGNVMISVFDFEKLTTIDTVEEMRYNESTGELEMDTVTNEKVQTLPSLAMLLDIRDNSIYHGLIELFTSALKSEGDYSYFEFQGMKFYLAKKENLLAFTNANDYITRFTKGNITESFEQNELSSKVKESAFFAHFNLNLEMYPDSIRQSFEGLLPSYPGGSSVGKVLSNFSHLQFRAINQNTGEISLGVNNKTGDNSLKVLIDMLSQL